VAVASARHKCAQRLSEIPILAEIAPSAAAMSAFRQTSANADCSGGGRSATVVGGRRDQLGATTHPSARQSPEHHLKRRRPFEYIVPGFVHLRVSFWSARRVSKGVLRNADIESGAEYPDAKSCWQRHRVAESPAAITLRTESGDGRPCQRRQQARCVASVHAAIVCWRRVVMRPPDRRA
jgi:hypothetical protein